MTEYNVYRGQYGVSENIQTSLPCITFTSQALAEIYARCPNNSRYNEKANPKVFQATITINNLFMNEPKDPFIEAEVLIEKLGHEEATRICKKFAAYIEVTDNWNDIRQKTLCTSVEEFLNQFPEKVSDLYFLAWPFLDAPAEVELLKNKGFDGAIHGSSGIGDGYPEYKVFSKDQIKITRIQTLLWETVKS